MGRLAGNKKGAAALALLVLAIVFGLIVVTSLPTVKATLLEIIKAVRG